MIRKKKKKNLYRRTKNKIQNLLLKNRSNINAAIGCLVILAAVVFVLGLLNS
jgi:hypothetical protein